MKAPILAILAAMLASGAPAQEAAIVNSAGPQGVGVTIYRAPGRPADRKLDLGWLGGYALVSETRTITIPAGTSEIRFEGVADGIMPQSAIVTGLPEGVIEKNQDAWLLSPGSLIERTLGKRVHLHRTSRETGAVREQEAIVRSGANGGVVLQTQDGFEALRCGGLAETVRHEDVPQGLSAKPTLSVRTTARQPVSATVTLSYLASGFDWQANYVATLSPGEDRLDLFAWVTLANGDSTTFVEATTSAVAGRLNRSEAAERVRARAQPLVLQCWPAGTTSDIPVQYDRSEEIVVRGNRAVTFGPPPPPPPPPPAAPPAPAMMAQQEELGDLKLYRIPEPVTVAAKSQKQVALLKRQSVKVEQVYRSRVVPQSHSLPMPAERIIKMRNREADGLGLPLPAGSLVLFAGRGEQPLLIGEGSVEDKAIGEDVEVRIGTPTGVIALVTELPDDDGYELSVTNDRNRPVRYEAEFGEDIAATGSRLQRRDGRWLWATTIPPNGRAKLRFRRSEAPGT